MNRAEPHWLTPSQVEMLHAETIRLFGGRPGLREASLLESALARPRHRFDYDEQADLYDLAAEYGYGLARNHPFVDGNKRGALLAIRAFLFINKMRFMPDPVETVTMIERLAAGEVDQQALAVWSRANATLQ